MPSDNKQREQESRKDLELKRIEEETRRLSEVSESRKMTTVVLNPGNIHTKEVAINNQESIHSIIP